MKGKLLLDELLAIEKKHSLWEYKLFDYPLWIHCREPLLSGGIIAERKINRPIFRSMLKSFLETMKFLMTQKKYDKVFFLMERAELLEIYKNEKNSKKLLFLNPEQEKVYEKNDYISSDFFSLLRFISRKIAFRIFRKKYNKVKEKIEELHLDTSLEKYLQVAMGDAFFLKFLSLILSKKSDKFYTGAVIPMGEKFVNRLNSYEVQHGVIHPSHIGYVGLPEVQNTLILYSKRYESIMRKFSYVGLLKIDEYKKIFFKKKSTRSLPIVIYTQPTIDMQEAVNVFIQQSHVTNVYLQKHPKDYFEYEIDESFLVNATIPSEVSNPIMYASSVIENFTLFNRDCYIYDLKRGDDVEKFLEIYTLGTESKMIIMDSLDDIYKRIMRNI